MSCSNDVLRKQFLKKTRLLGEVYYGDITSSNLDMIKRLKEEHEEIKKRSASDSKHM